MKYSTSLKLNHIFRRLYHTSGFADGLLVLYARKNRTAENRVGITVSKKLGHAVVRNRVRRRFRELYRLHKCDMLPGYDIIMVARFFAAGIASAGLEKQYLRWFSQLGLLREDA